MLKLGSEAHCTSVKRLDYCYAELLRVHVELPDASKALHVLVLYGSRSHGLEFLQ